RLIFEGEHYSIMAVPGFKDRTILLDGFSKTYAMTGWRMGYGVMRADLAAHMTRLMTNSNSCTASFTQVAGIEALQGNQSSVDKMRNEFQRRRDAFVAGLNKIKGFSCRLPKGAFYVFPNIREPVGPQRSSPTRCWNKRAWPACRERRSVISGKATCASAWRTLSRTLIRHSTAFVSGPGTTYKSTEI